MVKNFRTAIVFTELKTIKAKQHLMAAKAAMTGISKKATEQRQPNPKEVEQKIDEGWQFNKELWDASVAPHAND